VQPYQPAIRLLTDLSFSPIENQEFEVCGKTLTPDVTMKLAKELAEMKDLVSLTFEGNFIQDEAGVCALFSNLKAFDKLENINIR